MPNQNFVDPKEMASCDLSLSYNNKCHEKICRFSYTSWCPTCDKESPRRRCRSESLEPCRRRGKEMKTFSPRKYEKNQEYENMDLDYETKDLRFDSCRIRSNLCELPTSYISNNCQLTKIIPDCQNDCTDTSEKCLKIHENSFSKPFDIHNQPLNFGNMPEKQDKNKAFAKDEDAGKNLNRSVYKFNSLKIVEHVTPHFPTKSADVYQKSLHQNNVGKTGSLNGFSTKGNEEVLKEFIERSRAINSNAGQNYQPFKNSKEVYNKLLEAECRNAHIVNKINLIESFKNPVESTKCPPGPKKFSQNLNQGVTYQSPKIFTITNEKAQADNQKCTCSQISVQNQNASYEDQKSNFSQNESKRCCAGSLNFCSQKSLFEKQISRFEELKTQLENQKSLLECQKAYFEQKRDERPNSTPLWLTNSSKVVTKQPVKITKTNIGNVEMNVGGTSIHYDTSTYYDNVKDIANLREKYYQEIETLRMRMNEIREPRYHWQNNSGPNNGNQGNSQNVAKDSKQNIPKQDSNTSPSLNALKKDHLRSDCNTSPSHNVLKKDRLKSVSKVSLKTKKLNSVKLRKARSKITNDLSASDSECSDSENYEKVVDHTESLDSIDTIESILSNETEESEGKGDGDGSSWPLRPSLFPHIPPYIKFNIHDAPEPFKLPKGSKYLKWKLSNITPILVRKTLTNTGFRLIRKSNEWLGTWGKHMKSPMFKTLKENQKLNHFPGTFQIGRKDRLWRNLQRLMILYGHKEFGFIPKTYILPQEFKILKQNWKNGGENEKWIIKPPASARGTGIKVIHKWSQLPKRANLIVQRYISNPFLINGSKFDLRLYVLVTSFDPLRIYLYPEGLVRFASVQYSDSNKDLKDKYMHLTNYSINKMSSNYTVNDDANSCQGHKWTLSKLWDYLRTKHIDTKGLWKCLQQLVIKTLISGEHSIVGLGRENITNRYNCYELFGIDVLLDEKLEPWLLEVNISPSLHSQSPLDAHVKGPMVQSLFNLAQFHLPSKLERVGCSQPCYDSKLYSVYLLKKERIKHMHFVMMERREEYLNSILYELTGDDVRHLTQAEDELQAIGNFERIFPSSHTHRYFQYMEPRYYNRLFDAWEYRYDRNRKAGIKLLQGLCETKIHLKVASPPKITQSLPNTSLGGQNNQQSNSQNNQQQLINPISLNPLNNQPTNLLGEPLINPHYLMPSREGHSHPTSDLSMCPLALGNIKTFIASPLV